MIEKVDWEQTKSLTLKLCDSLSEAGMLHRLGEIVAIARGGLIPGTLLSHHLELPLKVISGELDDWVLLVARAEASGDLALVIDDISDTGRIFTRLKNKISLIPAELKRLGLKVHPTYRSIFAALIVKPEGKPTVDFYAKEVPQDVWVEFCWEQPGHEWTRGIASGTAQREGRTRT